MMGTTLISGGVQERLARVIDAGFGAVIASIDVQWHPRRK